MRPRSITWFECAAGLQLALNAWQIYQRLFSSRFISADLLRMRALNVTAFAIIASISLPLIWLIGRRASSLAKWLYVSLNLARIAATFIVPLVTRHSWPTIELIGWIQLILVAGSIWLLFRPDAKLWFARIQPVDPNVFS